MSKPVEQGHDVVTFVAILMIIACLIGECIHSHRRIDALEAKATALEAKSPSP